MIERGCGQAFAIGSEGDGRDGVAMSFEGADGLGEDGLGGKGECEGEEGARAHGFLPERGRARSEAVKMPGNGRGVRADGRGRTRATGKATPPHEAAGEASHRLDSVRQSPLTQSAWLAAFLVLAQRNAHL